MIPKGTLLITKQKGSLDLFFRLFFERNGQHPGRTATRDKGFPLSMSLGMLTRSVDLTIEQAIIILPSIIPL